MFELEALCIAMLATAAGQSLSKELPWLTGKFEFRRGRFTQLDRSLIIRSMNNVIVEATKLVM
jgi:hypothetical protein